MSPKIKKVILRKSSGSWSNLWFKHIPSTSLYFIDSWTFASHFYLASTKYFSTCVCTCKDTFAFTKIIYRTVNLNIWIGCDWSFGCTCNTWTKFLKFSLSSDDHFWVLKIKSCCCFGDASDNLPRWIYFITPSDDVLNPFWVSRNCFILIN